MAWAIGVDQGRSEGMTEDIKHGYGVVGRMMLLCMSPFIAIGLMVVFVISVLIFTVAHTIDLINYRKHD
jgi:hypothetical protein